MIDHIRWAESLDFLDHTAFQEMNGFAEAIKTMRDLNEHSIEYFLESGRKPEQWVSETADAIADASSTINSRIGNRLDWNEVAAARRLTERLPNHWFPESGPAAS